METVPASDEDLLRAAHTRLRSPPRFRALLLATAGVVAVWLLDFSTAVLPSLGRIDRQSRCAESDEQLGRSCRLVVLSFCSFVAVRILLRSDEQAEYWRILPLRLRIFRRRVRCPPVPRPDLVPLCLFCLTSCRVVARLASASQCETFSPELYSVCRRFAFLGCLVGGCCASLVLWRGQLLRRQRQRGARGLALGRGRRWPEAPGVLRAAAGIWPAAAGFVERIAAVPYDPALFGDSAYDRPASGFIEQIVAVPYDPALFGDADGRRYAGECPICLDTWEPDDDIRVPSCGHAFHKVCLGRWLQTEGTCALCRREVTDDLKDLGQGLATLLTQMSAMAPTAPSARRSPFECKFPPGISVDNYVARVLRFSRCSPGCVVVSLIYLDRVIKMHPWITVSPLSCHRLVLTSVVIAMKFNEDTYYSNDFYSQVGGIALTELSSLEKHFLGLVDGRLGVDRAEYDIYRGVLQKAGRMREAGRLRESA